MNHVQIKGISIHKMHYTRSKYTRTSKSDSQICLSSADMPLYSGGNIAKCLQHNVFYCPGEFQL